MPPSAGAVNLVPLHWAGAPGVAVDAAVSAAVDALTIDWERGLLREGELPKTLQNDPAMVLIFLLPRIFRRLDPPRRMAAVCAELWQYGKSENWRLRSESQLPGTGKFWKFDPKIFDGSDTLSHHVRSLLDDCAGKLALMESPAGRVGSGWSAIREFAEQLRRERQKLDAWTASSPSYRDVLARPRINLENRGVTTLDYLARGEFPLHSDAFGALGAFGLRSYVQGEFRKKSGDPKIYFKPARLAVRIWDSYDFKDAEAVTELGKAVAKIQPSQPLGRWKESASRQATYLTNSDFETFRNSFMPKYNDYLLKIRSNRPRLFCEDFLSISEYIERPLSGHGELTVLD